MTIWWLALALVVAWAVSAGQNEPGSPGPADLVSYAVGVPLSAEQVEEYVRGIADNYPTVRVTRSRVFRDSDGRLRIERSSGPNESYVFLFDPSSGARVVMSAKDKIAYQFKGAKQGDNGFAYGAAGLGEALPSGHWTTGVEDLGQRAIDGIDAEGERITQTSADHPPLVAVYERWYSRDLKVVMSAAASGPNWRHTARIQNLRTGEIDPSLFSVPAGYKVINVKPGNPVEGLSTGSDPA